MRTIAFVLLCTALAPAQSDVRELLEKKTLASIEELDSRLDGALGAAAIDLNTGRTLAYRADTVFPTASAIKVPVMLEVFRQVRAGRLRFDREVPLTSAVLVDSSPRVSVMLRNGPAKATVRELVEAMIEASDNSAANLLIDLAGMERINRTLDELGLPNTRLRRKMMDWTDTEHRENISTPLEMARLMEMIYQAKAAHEEDCVEMLKIMKRVNAGFRRAVPAQIEVAAKPGELPGAFCETGVVFVAGRPFALAVMSTFVADNKDPVAGVASVVYSFFDKLAAANRYGHRIK